MKEHDSTLIEVDALDAELASLRATLVEALASQWEPSPIPRPSDDTAERSKGVISDPTPSIAMDGRRMALRVTVLETERALSRARMVIRELDRRVSGAVSRWENTVTDT